MDFNEATIARAEALDTLVARVKGIASAEDYGNMLGAVGLVEHAAQQARGAIVTEARAAGGTWKEIGDALGVTRQAAEARFGAKGRVAERPIQAPTECAGGICGHCERCKARMSTQR